MDMTKLGEAYRGIRVPEGETSTRPTGQTSTESLLALVQRRDEQERKALRKATLFFGIATGIYLFVTARLVVEFLATPEASPSRLIGFSIIGLIFAIKTILMLRHRRRLARIDYGRPVGEFLADAERRYDFLIQQTFPWSLPLLGLLGFGGWFLWEYAFLRIFPEAGTVPLLAGYVFFFLAVSAAGYYFTYRDWLREKGPIWREIERMRRELQERSDDVVAS
jgi:hypothetical protein